MLDPVLTINDKQFFGWQSVTIRRSIETVSGSFSLSVTDRWAVNGEPRPINAGDRCQLKLGDRTLINGFVDDVSISYDAGSHSITVSGRDKTADLVDCSAHYASGQIKNRDLLDIAVDLCKPYQVKVSKAPGVDISPNIKDVTIEDGDTVFEVIEDLARKRNVLLLSDMQGDLLIAKPSKQKIPRVIAFGDNVLSCDYSVSMRERYRHYIVKSQSSASDDTDGAAAASLKSESQDNAVRMNRTQILVADAQSIDDCQKRSDWQRKIQAARGVQLSYTLQGWEYAPNQLWRENRMVTVDDAFINVRNTDLLIVSVEYSKDASGSRTQLTLAPRANYEQGPS